MGEWTYEKQDFLTTAPYEELYKLHKEPFVHETKLAELADYAKSVGFTSFRKMYKQYVQSIKVQANTIYVDDATHFSGQPLELRSGDWEAEDDGVRRRGGGFLEDVACPHPILPVERLVNIDQPGDSPGPR